MGEPFKNNFNTKMIAHMAQHFSRVSAKFNKALFIQHATSNLDALELKERSTQICDALEASLPTDYHKACTIMLEALHPGNHENPSDSTTNAEDGICGWGLMPMGEFVAKNGLDEFDFSLKTLKEFTKHFSAEFDVRRFILADTERAMSHIFEWTGDDNYHVRRLASEGIRPRLPWAFQLRPFIEDPTAILPILELLKDDPTEYVRRSVANNLNDIAKDHPDLIADLMSKWMDNASVERKKLVRHALRSLIKTGNPLALSALGYSAPAVVINEVVILTPDVEYGEALEFSLDMTSLSTHTQPLIIDYVVHHMRANGKLSPKVFKWKNIQLKPKQNLKTLRRHSIRPISTRLYYAGVHKLEIVINGMNYDVGKFILQMED